MTLASLAGGPPLDLVVIGGGINGCAIAEEAAARGLKTALFEQDDFGFGTTWRSTRLIHGGLRYLEHGDLRLVFESLRERAWLLATRSHLVVPQRFVLPILPWTRRPAWQLAAGLALYDLLALYRAVPPHRRISEPTLHNLLPALSPQAGSGFTFFDARALAPERLCLELALEARRHGATLANHARVVGLDSAHGAISAVKVEHSGSIYTIPARTVINAAGPWVDAVNRAAGLESPPLLGVTRGTHIAVEVERPSRDAVFSTARRDGRVFFAVPQGDLLLIGTTDDRFDGDPGDVRPTRQDVDYLLSEAQALLPGLDLSHAAIRYAYAGLRPLQRMPGRAEDAVTRRHALIDHRRSGGPAGLYSVVGGKLSTFRPLAREAIRRLHPPGRRSPSPPHPSVDWRSALRNTGLPLPIKRHLRVYGPEIPCVVADGAGPLCPHAGAITGEIRHAAQHEQATTLADIMMRRTGISWARCRGLCCHQEAASIAAEVLHWDAAEKQRQISTFEASVARHLPTEQELAIDQPSR